MKSINRIIAICILVLTLIFVGFNLWILKLQKQGDGRPYLVEISRLAETLETAEPDLTQCRYVKKIILCENDSQLSEESKYNYCIRQVGDKLYRFEYQEEGNYFQPVIVGINVVIALMGIGLIAVLLYLKKRIIMPFHKLEAVPYELSKGNLTPEIQEEQSKYFGKFTWGLNMLRENLQDRRQKELNMHRDKKLLLLSLTHDIKTPLSVIKLNAQAVSKGLFKDEDRIKEAASTISLKVDEIEEYVSQITQASRDDFLDLSVTEQDFYLSEVIKEISESYENKLSVKKIRFVLDDYSDCILYGDKDRLVEVIQNLMENAIKYGDGEYIHIGFEREEGCCLISIENSGATLDKSELTKIFDSFFRGSNAGNEPGSGLGLYICRQLMSRMNGDIFVKESNSTFVSTVVVRM